jgi:hypothetical protein
MQCRLHPKFMILVSTRLLIARAARLAHGFATSLNQRRKLRVLESYWQHAADARDSVFIARVTGRYRDQNALHTLPPLHPRESAPTSITAEEWEALAATQRKDTRDAVMDVIFPVTDSYEVTLASLYILLSSKQRAGFRVAVILSHHPDHRLIDKLRRLHESNLFDLFIDSGEEGMVSLTNFVLQRHDTRDVVLYSSHHHCPDYALDRLLHVAQTSPDCATVSPFLTSGGITGYPDTQGALAAAVEPTAVLDDICQNLFADAPPQSMKMPALDVMLIRREAMHSIGLLPEKSTLLSHALLAWAELADSKSYHHLFTPNVLFGVTSGHRVDALSVQIQNLHPHIYPYSHAIEGRLIDSERLRRNYSAPALVINGIQSTPRRTSNDPICMLTPDIVSPAIMRVGLPDARLYPHLRFAMDTGFLPLSELCEKLGVTQIEVRGLAGFPSRMVEWVGLFSRQTGIPYTLIIEDDYLICPGLIGINKHCDAEDLESCYRSFADSYPLDSDGMPLWLWRVRSANLIANAARIEFATEHLKTLFSRYFAWM